MPFTNYQENIFLDYLFDNTTIYVGWSTTVPTKVGGNVSEPSGNGYARVTTSASDWTAAATGALSNANAITHDEATGSQGTPAAVVLYDALTNGNLLGYSATVTGAEAIDNGETVRWAAGDIDVQFAQS